MNWNIERILLIVVGLAAIAVIYKVISYLFGF